ncbi:hypothetical protein [Neosynechococcus sphagnicola]|uniref:hypothetical protein n=1 Tax=Neosynechococcus sphagnicola TaxID=1501145 RepID=UPI0030842B5A
MTADSRPDFPMTELAQEITAEVQRLQARIASLLIYQAVLSGEVGTAFQQLLQALSQPTKDGINCLHAYGQWFYALAQRGQSWQEYLLQTLLKTENPFSLMAQQVEFAHLPQPLVAAVRHDLQQLQQLYVCSGDQLSLWVQALSGGAMARGRSLTIAPVVWPSQSSLTAAPFQNLEDWAAGTAALAAYYRQQGTGLVADYRALRWHGGSTGGHCPCRWEFSGRTGWL